MAPGGFRSCLLTGLLCTPWLGVGAAGAHVPAHPEWADWLMMQQNQNNGMCCDGEDTLMLDDDEWRTANLGGYEVRVDGHWQAVPDWALTRTRDNITGHALLWLWRGRVQCFKPGTLY